MKKAAFIFAHMDDETILSYGTMLKLSRQYLIEILILCGNGRQLQQDGKSTRRQAFIDNCAAFQYEMLEYNDLAIDRNSAKRSIQQWIDNIKPSLIFTHAVQDLHFEHRFVAEETIIACRKIPGFQVKGLYSATSAACEWSYGQYGHFQPNYFVDISEFAEVKLKALRRYGMELPENKNDIRSAESIMDYAALYGRLMGVDYCECYQQLFRLV